MLDRTECSLNYGIIKKNEIGLLWQKYVIFESHKSYLLVFFLIVLEIVVKNPPTPNTKMVWPLIKI